MTAAQSLARVKAWFQKVPRYKQVKLKIIRYPQNRFNLDYINIREAHQWLQSGIPIKVRSPHQVAAEWSSLPRGSRPIRLEHSWSEAIIRITKTWAAHLILTNIDRQLIQLQALSAMLGKSHWTYVNWQLTKASATRSDRESPAAIPLWVSKMGPKWRPSLIRRLRFV